MFFLFRGMCASSIAESWTIELGINNSGKLFIDLKIANAMDLNSTKKIKYLEENMGALDVKLTKEENQTIRDAVENAGETSGPRYHDNMMKVVFMDTPPLKE